MIAALPALLSGCTTLEEAAVARTDRLSGAPFYKSYRKADSPPEPALLLPLSVTSMEASRLEPLRVAIDEYLRRQVCCLQVTGALPVAGRPRVYVGSSEGESAPVEAADIRQDHEEYPPMIVHLEKASDAWKQSIATVAGSVNAHRIIVTQLDFAQYPKTDHGFFGKKVVLGTNHEKPVRFLSAVDKPIEVLQLSGVVLDAHGTELCAGAEGIVGTDAPFWIQVLEAGRDIDDETLRQVLENERREDVPGKPLAWQVAADQLLWNLLQRCT